jgi:hypothetical protein
MATLNRAFPFIEMYGIPVLVGKHLELDMPGFD